MHARSSPIRRGAAKLRSWWAPDRESPRRSAPAPRRLLPRAERVLRPLTPHVATHAAPEGAPHAARTAFPEASSKAPDPNDPGHLPSTSARSALRRLRDGRPRARARHRYPCFAARDPASGAPSPSRSEEGTARPRPLPGALRARALLATRRSSTSATETIRKHDRRTPRPWSTAAEPGLAPAPCS